MADTPSHLQRETDAFRARLIRHDRRASAILSSVYADTLTQLESRLAALEADIAARLAAGETFSPSWLFRQARYQELITQVRVLMTQYGQSTGVVLTAAQQAAMRDALRYAGAQLAPISGGSGELLQVVAGWASIPDSSIQHLVGALQASTPLGQTLASYGPDAVQAVNRALTQGMALGLGAQEIGRDVAMALSITRARAETLVRTEVMRASRTATIAAYQQSGVVVGWRWSASLSSRTCPACISLHGQVFSLDTPMQSHVACRCSASPVLGKGRDAPWQSGEDWLLAQPDSVLASVLHHSGGVEAAQAIRSGEVQLSDFVRLVEAGASVPKSGSSSLGAADAQSWGYSYQAGSLVQARRSAERRQRRAA